MAGPGKPGRQALTLEGWTQIKVRREDHRTLMEAADRAGMSLAELVREIADRYRREAAV